MDTAIEGFKGGSGSQGSASEAPDSLVSTERARIIDILGEGTMRGFVHGGSNPMQDVYLNGTPVANADGTFNFTNVVIDSRSGTQDQAAMAGFAGVENEIAVGVELKSTAAWVQSLTNLTISAVRLKLSVPQLQKSDQSTGNITGYTINYTIELATDGGAYALVMSSAFTGKATSQYDRTHRIDLPKATTGWSLRVTRTTANANLATIADVTNILSYTEIVDAQFTYPNTAYVGVIIDAKQFSSVPTRAYNCYGRIISVPSNYDPIARTYTGTWDGTFKPAWTDNPAWIFYDLVTHPRFGLGQWVTAARVNKWNLYSIAQYCDELVPDGKGGTEPRFRCTVFLQTQADAYKVLADLTSVFRGMAFWAAGAVQAVADMPADPDFTYTNANVVDGQFSYQGSKSKTRFTVALVSWNDPNAFGVAKVAYVPDRDGIARYGVQPTSMIAVGCTSQGQAQRVGLWALLTSRLETEVVTFRVGHDGTLVSPGRIARIADARRALSRQGGRIHSATTTVVTIDAVPGTVAVGSTLTVTLPTGVTETQTITGISGTALTVGTPFSVAPLPEAMWVVETSTLVAQTFRILHIAEPKSSDADTSYTVTALLHNASKFPAIDSGAAIVIPPTVRVDGGSLPAPGNVTVSSFVVVGQVQSSNVLEITWSTTPGATKYLVRYRVGNGEWSAVQEVASTYLQIPGVKAGDYVAEVAAANANTVSPYTISPTYTLADPSTLPTAIGTIQKVASNAQPAFILNPNFADGLTNWVADFTPGGWYETTGPDSPNPQIGTYAVHAGASAPQNPGGVATTALRNLGFVPTSPGESFSVSVQIHNVGSPQGTANCRISWRDNAQNEISVASGNMITRTGTSIANGVAPVGAVYAHAEIAVYGHTSNDYFTFTGLKGGFQEIVETIDDANTTRMAQSGDTGQIIRGTNTSGLTITIPTIASAGWLNGTTLYALQATSAPVKFVGAAGVTFDPSDSQQTRAQGSLIAVKMIADDLWEAVGDLAYFFPATSVQANPNATSAQPVTLAATADKQVLKRIGGTLQWAPQVAGDVVVTPVGGIASTSTQAALAELDTKKVAVAALAESTPTAGATLVGVKPSGGIASTSLDAALSELDTKKATVPGTETFAIAAGAADALTATFTPALTLVDGMQIKLRAAAANATTTPTLAIGGGTARAITKQGNLALAAGDIKGAGHELLLRYVAATPRWELLNPAVASGGGGGGGTVVSVVAGTGISVNNADPTKPVVSATGSAAAAGPFTYWRILIRTTGAALSNTNLFSNIAEVEMAESSGGANACTGGTPFASSAYAGNPASSAFDGIHTDTTHQWSSAYGSFPQWLGYQFPTAKAIKELRIYPVVTVSNRAPADFVVQGSNDGRRWYDAGNFTPTNWADNTANVFSL